MLRANEEDGVDPDNLTVKQAAMVMRRHEATVRRYMRFGVRGRKLRHRLVGGEYRTSMRWITEFETPPDSTKSRAAELASQSDVEAELDRLLGA